MADLTEKYVALIQNQLQRLDEEKFDLEAWKSSTAVILSRIFGSNSAQIKELEKIRFEYGSWSLRDANGHSDQMASCKSRGRAILEASLTQLDLLGLEDLQLPEPKEENAISHALEEELKVSQIKELRKIARTKGSREEKKKLIEEKLLYYGSEISPGIVAHLLTEPEFESKF